MLSVHVFENDQLLFRNDTNNGRQDGGRWSNAYWNPEKLAEMASALETALFQVRGRQSLLNNSESLEPMR